ncbi:MAG: tRNA uridine-5-carboxymethylaminomethyl(34) synthesis GTPase MnmE [Betaproteobacteria bacterium]
MTRADIIAAVATAPGRGGIGVVRVSGPELGAYAFALLGKELVPRHVMRTAFLAADKKRIDDGVALYFPGPASFTGEDVLELHGHGGQVVLNMLLKRCLELGARLAEPGEFTRRAFLNDKIDLAQAEAVADLIDASSERAVRSAQRSLSGEFSAQIMALSRQIVDSRMLVEAMLDFPEEEIDGLDRGRAAEQLAALRQGLAAILAKARQGSVLRRGLKVVLAGRPNVGKSSLLNILAGQDLAIVTAIPGTTRDSVRETIVIDGIPLDIVDTAGLRETDDEVEKLGIARSWKEIGEADMLLLVCDARDGLTEQDRTILAQAPQRLKRLVVHNKIDLAGLCAKAEQREDCKQIWLSAKTAEGVAQLRQAMLVIAGWEIPGEDIFLARERHISALLAAQTCLGAAADQLSRPELFAEELRLAHNQLASITGEFTADDLLGEIFARFCIGK